MPEISTSEISSISTHELNKKRQVLMEYKRRIYTLSGKPEEVIAVAFAKCSRDPRPFDVIVEELDADKSRQFHERWVVGYGHGSVAEHAVAHIAIENVSILATKVIEDTRLASYTEKSTRYQIMEAGKCYKPKGMMPAGEIQFDAAVKYLFDTYALATEKVSELMKRKFPKGEKEPELRYNDRIKSKTCDVTRYLLPAGTMTQLGTTMNARSLEHCISKLMSSPMEEMRDIGKEMKEVALKEVPTLVKYASENRFAREYGKELAEIASNIPDKKAAKDIRLASCTPFAQRKVLESLIYRQSDLPYSAVSDYVKGLDFFETSRLIDNVMKQRGPHDPAPREFEEAMFTFDVLVDYGAYRDIQRHRIMSQTPQALSVKHGFETPEEIVEAGLKGEYAKAMEFAANAFEIIQCDTPMEARYVVPLGYKMRMLMTMNLREVFHFTELRSGKNGHRSYRTVAQKMADEVIKKYPEIGKHLRIDRS